MVPFKCSSGATCWTGCTSNTLSGRVAAAVIVVSLLCNLREDVGVACVGSMFLGVDDSTGADLRRKEEVEDLRSSRLPTFLRTVDQEEPGVGSEDDAEGEDIVLSIFPRVEVLLP